MTFLRRHKIKDSENRKNFPNQGMQRIGHETDLSLMSMFHDNHPILDVNFLG